MFQRVLYVVMEGIRFIAETCVTQEPAKARYDKQLTDKRRISGTATACSKRKVIAQGNLAY